jgi:spermidine/putrescine transport system permease protein
MIGLFKRKGLSVQDFPGFGGFSFLFYLYLYAPIVVLVVFSFNANQSATVWTGFSLDWYRAAFANQALRQAAGNSLLIAVCASMIATAIATLAALGTSRGAKFKGMQLSMGAIMLPLVLPEIVVGVATLALFSTIGLSLGYGNLIIAHTVFCIPFRLPADSRAAERHGPVAGTSLGRPLRRCVAHLSQGHPAAADAGDFLRADAGLHRLAG